MAKKLLAVLLAAVLLLGTASCGYTGSARGIKTGPRDGGDWVEKLSVVCTIFPTYDWVRQILGDRAAGVDLTLLLDGGSDMHSYQPSVEDIVKISSCDLFIYVGGESDDWIDDVLASAVNPDMLVINLLDTLGEAAKEEDAVEGMEDEGGKEPEYDEHVWLSLRNARVFCEAIADALSSLDSGNAEDYRRSFAAYCEKLDDLDSRCRAAADAAPVKTLLFCDRFPFRYLTDDYGLEYYAAFPGCSAETEASFETIAFLAGKLDELGLGAVMVTESADKTVAETVIAGTRAKNQQILVLDSIQSVTTGDVERGTDYLSIMESNLDVLKEALA